MLKGLKRVKGDERIKGIKGVERGEIRAGRGGVCVVKVLKLDVLGQLRSVGLELLIQCV